MPPVYEYTVSASGTTLGLPFFLLDAICSSFWTQLFHPFGRNYALLVDATGYSFWTQIVLALDEIGTLERILNAGMSSLRADTLILGYPKMLMVT